MSPSRQDDETQATAAVACRTRKLMDLESRELDSRARPKPLPLTVCMSDISAVLLRMENQLRDYRCHREEDHRADRQAAEEHHSQREERHQAQFTALIAVTQPYEIPWTAIWWAVRSPRSSHHFAGQRTSALPKHTQFGARLRPTSCLSSSKGQLGRQAGDHAAASHRRLARGVTRYLMRRRGRTAAGGAGALHAEGCGVPRNRWRLSRRPPGFRRVCGTMARRCRAAGRSHVAGYDRRSALGAATADLLLYASSHGSRGRCVLLSVLCRVRPSTVVKLGRSSGLVRILHCISSLSSRAGSPARPGMPLRVVPL